LVLSIFAGILPVLIGGWNFWDSWQWWVIAIPIDILALYILNQKDNNNHFCCIIPGHAFAAFSVLNSAALRAQIVMLQNEEGYYFEKSENRVISSLLYLF